MQTPLRTPDDRFAALPDWPWVPRYLECQGHRLAYHDEGPADAAVTALCLHGNPSWSYVYRHMLPVFTGAGLRVVAPDLIGFGRSDKPVAASAHSLAFHRQVLLELIERLDLHHVLLVVQDWGGLLGLTLPMDMPARFTRLLVMNTLLPTGDVPEGFRQWRAYSNSRPDLAVGALFRRGHPALSDAEVAAYDAPFPDASCKAAVRAFPNLVPDGPDAPGSEWGRRAARFWREQWDGESFMAIGMRDPVFGPPVMHALRATIRHCPPPMEVGEGGHFVQEWGGPIARAALARFGLLPPVDR